MIKAKTKCKNKIPRALSLLGLKVWQEFQVQNCRGNFRISSIGNVEVNVDCAGWKRASIGLADLISGIFMITYVEVGSEATTK